MLDRVPDTTICIPVDEYKELISTKVMHEAMSAQFWEMKLKYDKFVGAKCSPSFTGMEVENETTS